MKICVCSDSHGNPEGICRMLQIEKPDGLLFLGDGLRDFVRVDIPGGTLFYAVCGNCDLAMQEPSYRKLTLLDKKILMTHGHQDRVKQGLEALERRAADEEAQLVLYGHTHCFDAQRRGGALFINPGAMKDGENRYAVLWDEEGELKYSFKMVDWTR